MDTQNYFRNFPTMAFRKPVILAIVSVVVLVLIVDTSLIRISVLITSETGSAERINSFIILVITVIIGQTFVLGFVKQQTVSIRQQNKFYLSQIHNVVIIVQSVITVILVLLVLQIMISSQYYIALINLTVTISSLLAVSMLVLTARLFLSWLKSNRSIMILSFGVASAILAFDIAVELFYVVLVLSYSLPSIIVPHLGELDSFLIPGSLMAVLQQVSSLTSVVSFLTMWIASSILLRHFSYQSNRVKFWVSIAIPLIYFLSQFLALHFNVFGSLLSSPQSISYGMFLTLFFLLSRSAGGILFGVAFWIVTRKLPKNSAVRNYMIISACGLVLLFTSDHLSVLTSAPFPPFGVVASSLIGLSSYLILVGIYCSATSLANDSKLRQIIKQFAVAESKFLVSIGTAQMQKEIEDRVMRVAKK